MSGHRPVTDRCRREALARRRRRRRRGSAPVKGKPVHPLAALLDAMLRGLDRELQLRDHGARFGPTGRTAVKPFDRDDAVDGRDTKQTAARAHGSP